MITCPKCKATDEPRTMPGLSVNSRWETVRIHTVAVADMSRDPRTECMCLACGHKWEIPLSV